MAVYGIVLERAADLRDAIARIRQASDFAIAISDVNRRIANGEPVLVYDNEKIDIEKEVSDIHQVISSVIEELSAAGHSLSFLYRLSRVDEWEAASSIEMLKDLMNSYEEIIEHLREGDDQSHS